MPSFLDTRIIAQPDGAIMAGYAYPSSLAVLPDGRLFCSFFGLPVAGPEYSGCYASVSEDEGETWSEPELLIGDDGKHVYADPNVVIDDQRVMAFCTSFYTLGGADLSRSWTWKIVSEDSARTWGEPTQLNQPHSYMSGKVHAGLKLRDGTLIMGYSWDQVADRGGRAEGEGGQDYCCGVLRSKDGGETWSPGGDLHVHAEDKNRHSINGADEPALVLLDEGSLFALVRTGTDHLWESRSWDGGRTWEQPRPSPFVSHNCPADLLRLHGEPETVMAVFDHHPERRAPLCVACSTDGCHTWSEPKVLASAPEGWHAAYPVVCQTSTGTILVAYYHGQNVYSQSPTGATPLEASRLRLSFHIRCARFNREWLGV